jgi:hypothetical protein
MLLFIEAGRTDVMRSTVCILAVIMMTGGAARAGEMQIHVQASGGGVLTDSLEEFTHGGAGGFSIGFVWPVTDHLRLGLRQNLNLSVMSFGKEKDLTVLPSTAFLLKVDPVERLSLDLCVGVGLVASSELGRDSLLPHPVAGAGVELILARYNGSSLRLRVQCDAIFMALYESQPLLFIPQAGLLYVF